MKVLVLGGSGFLGSHVADALSSAGHTVTVFDRRPSPYLRRGQKMIVGDLLDAKTVDTAVRGHQAVFNFAGFADIESAQDHPLDTIRLNVLGNGIVLEACRKARVKRYLFASTMYVYSDAPSFYRASKQACEQYIECYGRLHGLEYTILRFGSLYGPRSDARNGIHNFLKAAIEKKKIVYWGTGDEMREYIHVRDAAALCVDALSPRFRDASLILTGVQPIRIKDLLVMIREIMKGRVKLEFRPKSRPDLADLHYTLTPYAFVPREARKLVRPEYVDLGQGLLSLMGELHGA